MKEHILENEVNVIPWMQLFAILVGLAILFFMGTVKVSAGLSPAGAQPILDPISRPTDCLPRDKAGLFGNKVWYVDVTDVSNESVQGNGKTSFNKATKKAPSKILLMKEGEFQK